MVAARIASVNESEDEEFRLQSSDLGFENRDLRVQILE
jgi:hypothetical protein